MLKDGRSEASNLPVASTPTRELISLMTGRDVENVFPPRVPVAADAPVVLEVDSLALAGRFEDVSLTIRAGEIVGLAGLVGSGRSEILETIAGHRKASNGTVRVSGKVLRPGSVRDAVAADMGLAPEERKSQGLILEEPIYRNATLSTFSRFAKEGCSTRRPNAAPPPSRCGTSTCAPRSPTASPARSRAATSRRSCSRGG
ncbi:hypothetical protein GCM10025876_28470 [Demequina litorisediminis]|uniref:ABC transporter domain-containing protein n=1 Tax=Demequina litorisediminis TaxID=1849022 RepID=A0ABQ6IHL3_9MICO|nr:hypothetical protein GCM10025876_28470 [Demequina litorisediminis]